MKQIINKDWNSLCRDYDWVADMHGVPQSPVHHAEGDVAVHTQMVLKALEHLPEYQSLPDDARQIIWMAALLHDVEKRSTTFTEADGSIVAPGHAKKGAMTARHILYTQFDLPFEEREQIVNLVRFHGLPLWLMAQTGATKSLAGGEFACKHRVAELLAQADMLGRICKRPGRYAGSDRLF